MRRNPRSLPAVVIELTACLSRSDRILMRSPGAEHALHLTPHVRAIRRIRGTAVIPRSSDGGPLETTQILLEEIHSAMISAVIRLPECDAS